MEENEVQAEQTEQPMQTEQPVQTEPPMQDAQGRPRPEQMERLVKDIRSANNLMDVWRRKAAKKMIDQIDRYMKARCRLFQIKGGYTIGDILKFFCAVTATMIAHIVEQIREESNWTQDEATEMRAMFDNLLDEYLGKVLGMPHMTTMAVLALGEKRQAEQNEAQEREAEAARNREESARARKEAAEGESTEEPQEAPEEPQGASEELQGASEEPQEA